MGSLTERFLSTYMCHAFVFGVIVVSNLLRCMLAVSFYTCSIGCIREDLPMLWRWNASSIVNYSRFLFCWVKCIFTGRSYYFNCEKWFSVDEEHGRIEREITVLEGGLGFHKVFSHRAFKFLISRGIDGPVAPPYSFYDFTQRAFDHEQKTERGKNQCVSLTLDAVIFLLPFWEKHQPYGWRGSVQICPLWWPWKLIHLWTEMESTGWLDLHLKRLIFPPRLARQPCQGVTCQYLAI